MKKVFDTPSFEVYQMYGSDMVKSKKEIIVYLAIDEKTKDICIMRDNITFNGKNDYLLPVSHVEPGAYSHDVILNDFLYQTGFPIRNAKKMLTFNSSFIVNEKIHLVVGFFDKMSVRKNFKQKNKSLTVKTIPLIEFLNYKFEMGPFLIAQLFIKSLNFNETNIL